MKILWRVFYALAVMILFLFADNYARNYITDKYFEAEVDKALNQESPSFYFFYGSVGYHTREAFFRKKVGDITVAFYEIGIVEKEKGENVVREYLYPVVYRKDNPIYTGIDADYGILYISSDIDEEINEPKSYYMNLARFREFDVSLGVTRNGEALIPKDEFLGKNIVSIEVVKAFDGGYESYYHSNITFEENMFVIAKPLLENIGNDQKLIDEYGIYPKNIHSAHEFQYIYWIMMASYLVIVAIVTYFIFFFKRKKLGREKPSEYFYKKISTDSNIKQDEPLTMAELKKIDKEDNDEDLE